MTTEQKQANMDDLQGKIYERRLEHLEEEVGDLKASNARVETNISAILGRLDTISDKQDVPVENNTIGWIGTALSCLTIIAAFGWVIIQPMQEKLADQDVFNKAEIEHMVEEAYTRGQQENRMEFMEREIIRVRDRQEKVLIKVRLGNEAD